MPDFARSEPKNWSYRDLVLGRLMGWLRILGMPLEESAARLLGTLLQPVFACSNANLWRRTGIEPAQRLSSAHCF